MTTEELKIIAKNEGNLNIYSIKNITEKGNKGVLITYSEQLNDTTESTEKQKEYWNLSLEEIADQFIYNRKEIQ